MVRSRFSVAICLVVLIVVAASGCTASPAEVEAAEQEAATEFLVIEGALQAFAAETGEFPRSNRTRAAEALSELDLDPEITTPSNDKFAYYYSSFSDSGAEPCRYRISLTEIKIDLSDIVLTKEHSICDPAAIQRLEEKRVAANAEAQQQSSEIGRALNAYYDKNGTFPVSLDSLDLEVEHVDAYIVYDDESGAMSARNGEVVSDFDSGELCRYELWVHQSGLGDRRRMVDNCE